MPIGTCEMIRCQQKDKPLVAVNENISDASYVVWICKDCCTILGVTQGGDLPRPEVVDRLYREFTARLNAGIEQLQEIVNQPMSPREARLLSIMDQQKAAVRDDPELRRRVQEKLGCSDEDMEEWMNRT